MCSCSAENRFDCIVTGGGHAGSEAAVALARLGLSVLLISGNVDRLGYLSCNPAIGGLAKGHMVREIDALGGMMGLWADAGGIQFRTLNMSKGPAVRATRARLCGALVQMLAQMPVRQITVRELAQLADDDAAVFNKFMEAYKMPKATDTEKAMRTAAIGQAAIAAAEVPMQIADKSLEVLKLARKLIVFGNPNAISDGTVSALMARAALRSALYNVKINLGLIKDDEYVAAARAKMQQLEAKAMEIEAFVLARTDEVLK